MIRARSAFHEYALSCLGCVADYPGSLPPGQGKCYNAFQAETMRAALDNILKAIRDEYITQERLARDLNAEPCHVISRLDV